MMASAFRDTHPDLFPDGVDDFDPGTTGE